MVKHFYRHKRQPVVDLKEKETARCWNLLSSQLAAWQKPLKNNRNKSQKPKTRVKRTPYSNLSEHVSCFDLLTTILNLLWLTSITATSFSASNCFQVLGNTQLGCIYRQLIPHNQIWIFLIFNQSPAKQIEAEQIHAKPQLLYSTNFHLAFPVSCEHMQGAFPQLPRTWDPFLFFPHTVQAPSVLLTWYAQLEWWGQGWAEQESVRTPEDIHRFVEAGVDCCLESWRGK